MGIQTALHLIYPPQCTVCGTHVESDFGICGICWRDTPFIAGLCCDACGVPLPGQDTGHAELCDECLVTARPWHKGRSALLYKDNGRKLVLALKHGDRQDVARPAAKWLAKAAQPLLSPDMLIAPVPLHWTRLLRRRFNQAAVLARALSNEVGLACCPDLLIRPRRTQSLDGKGKNERFTAVLDAIKVHPRRRHRLIGRDILLVDDVMTSGATLAAATEACQQAGARNVCVVTLARVAKDH